MSLALGQSSVGNQSHRHVARVVPSTARTGSEQDDRQSQANPFPLHWHPSVAWRVFHPFSPRAEQAAAASTTPDCSSAHLNRSVSEDEVPRSRLPATSLPRSRFGLVWRSVAERPIPESKQRASESRRPLCKIQAAIARKNYFFLATSKPFSKASSLKTRLICSSPLALATLAWHFSQQKQTLTPATSM